MGNKLVNAPNMDIMWKVKTNEHQIATKLVV
jgi:hypothetical protein